MSTNKLVTLAHLRSLAERVKSEDAALAAKLEQLANTVEGRITGLESAGFQTAEQVQAAIAAASHLKYAVADAVPSAEEADANTWYLVKNEETGHYDIYGLIEDEVRIIDDTTIDLTGYTTTDAMKAWVAQEIAALNIDQYATDAEMASALERIGALESALDNYYTKAETEEYVGNQLQMFRDVVIDGMVNDITALGNRVTALEEGMDGYATDDEAAAAAADAIAANTATDEEANAAINEVWDSESEG